MWWKSKPRIGSVAYPAAPEGSGRVVVERPADSWNDFTRRYELLVDGAVRCSLRRGEEQSFVLPAGTYEAEGRIDWCKSHPLAFAVAAGGTTRLRLRSGLTGWRAILVFATVFLGARGYLELEQVEGPEPPPRRPRELR